MESLTRRSAFAVGGFGAAAAIGASGRLDAAEPTPSEKANIQVVNDFCAAWPSHDLAKIMSFFADPCAYRVTEAMEPVKGRQAVSDRIQGFLDKVEQFQVIETFAKGPMVFNERMDRFLPGGPLKSWHGVGVFFLKDGKIVEWYDYTIAAVRV